MIWISGILKFFTNSKNLTYILFIVIMGLAALFFYQKSRTDHFKIKLKDQVKETARMKNNWEASEDSIETYHYNNGKMRGEIKGYNITLTELQEQYSELFSMYDEWKDQAPHTIIETRTIIKETIRDVDIGIQVDAFGNEYAVFDSDTTYSEGNSRSITGVIPFSKHYFDIDSTKVHRDSIEYYAKLIPGKGTFGLEQNIALITGLSIEKETKKPIIWIETRYPGVTFTEITGASIIDDEMSKKTLRQLRKTFGLGVQIGYGAIYTNETITGGPYIGVGINYTPKFLQW